MSDIITLTGPEVRITGQTSLQTNLAVDVSAYDVLDCNLLPTCVITSGTPSCVIGIYAGMQADSADDWTHLTDMVFSGAGSVQKATYDGNIFRYVSWKCTTFSGLSIVGFCIRVVARRRAIAAFY